MSPKGTRLSTSQSLAQYLPRKQPHAPRQSRRFHEVLPIRGNTATIQADSALGLKLNPSHLPPCLHLMFKREPRLCWVAVHCTQVRRQAHFNTVSDGKPPSRFRPSVSS